MEYPIAETTQPAREFSDSMGDDETRLARLANLIREEREERQAFQKHFVAQLAKITELLEKRIQQQRQFTVPANPDVQELKTKQGSTDQESKAITTTHQQLEGSLTTIQELESGAANHKQDSEITDQQQQIVTFPFAMERRTTTEPVAVVAAARGEEERHNGIVPNRERLTASAECPGSINGEAPIAVVPGDEGRVSSGEGPWAVAGEHPPTVGAQRKEGRKPLSLGLNRVSLLDLRDRSTGFVIEAPPRSGSGPRRMTGSWSSMTEASAMEADTSMEVVRGFLGSNVLREKREGYHGLCVLLVVLPLAVASEQPLTGGRRDQVAPLLVSSSSTQRRQREETRLGLHHSGLLIVLLGQAQTHFSKGMVGPNVIDPSQLEGGIQGALQVSKLEFNLGLNNEPNSRIKEASGLSFTQWDPGG